MINVLFAGDIVGSRGCDFAEDTVRRLKGKEKIDIVIVNGENSADGNGITKRSMEQIFSFADVITTGNHCFRRKEFTEYYDIKENLLRPANYPDGVAGHGVCVLDMGAYSFAVVNLMGTAFMEPLNNPFECIDRLLEDIHTPNIFVDFHAEATSEKLAMGYMLDGQVSAVWGTHTHVPTADARVLPKGTGYVTDLGMTGPRDSVLGIRPELSIAKFRGDLPERYRWAEGAAKMEAVLFTIDSETGKCRKAERVDKWD